MSGGHRKQSSTSCFLKILLCLKKKMKRQVVKKKKNIDSYSNIFILFYSYMINNAKKIIPVVLR